MAGVDQTAAWAKGEGPGPPPKLDLEEIKAPPPRVRYRERPVCVAPPRATSLREGARATTECVAHSRFHVES